MKYHVLVQAADGRELNSWGVLPIGQTKILDGIYDPESKVLRLLLDAVTEQYVPVEIQDEKTKKITIQNRKLQTYYKAHILEQDIKAFLELNVENDFEFEASVSNLIVNDD